MRTSGRRTAPDFCGPVPDAPFDPIASPDSRRPGRGRRNTPEVSWNVMVCHVPHAQGTYPVARSGMAPSFRAKVPGIPLGSGAGPSSAWVPPLAPVSFPPPGRRRVPFPRAFRAGVRAGARAGVGAGAVRAADCARETADTPRPSVPAGVFFAAPAIAFCRKAERRPRKPPLSPFIILHFLPGQAL